MSKKLHCASGCSQYFYLHIYTYINFLSLLFIRYLIYFVKSWHLFRNIIIHNRCFNNISNYIKIFVCMYHFFFAQFIFHTLKKDEP